MRKKGGALCNKRAVAEAAFTTSNDLIKYHSFLGAWTDAYATPLNRLFSSRINHDASHSDLHFRSFSDNWGGPGHGWYKTIYECYRPLTRSSRKGLRTSMDPGYSHSYINVCHFGPRSPAEVGGRPDKMVGSAGAAVVGSSFGQEVASTCT